MNSPCISQCVLNKQAVCTGCYRSIEEISHWSLADRKARLKILHAAKQRRAEENK